jgi:hypothetical protein
MTTLGRLCLVSLVVGLIVSAAGSAYAVSGPSGGAYLYWTVMQTFTSYECSTWNMVGNPYLYALKFDQNWDCVSDSLQKFTPYVPDNYGGGTSHVNVSKAGEWAAAPVLYRAPTSTSHAQILMGVYANNYPAAKSPTPPVTGQQVMDVYRLSPNSISKTDNSMSRVNVYDGKAKPAGTSQVFHTEDQEQVYYSKSAGLTGAANSLVVSSSYVRGDCAPLCANTARGYITDGNSDGDWNDAEDTDTYQSRGSARNYGIQVGSAIYCGANRYFNESSYGLLRSPYTTGIDMSMRKPDGTILNICFYDDNYAANKYTVQYGGGSTPGEYRYPYLAGADVDGDGSNDIYAAVKTGNGKRWGIIHLEDKDGDYRARAANESSLIFEFDNSGSGDWVAGELSLNYSCRMMGLVPNDNGEWTLVFGFAYDTVHGGGSTKIGAIQLDHNGEYKPGEKKLLLKAMNPPGSSSPLWWYNMKGVLVAGVEFAHSRARDAAPHRDRNPRTPGLPPPTPDEVSD